MPSLVYWKVILSFLLSVALLSDPAAAVKRENFKTCDQSGFCRRNRQYADVAVAAAGSWVSPYILDSNSISFKDGQLKGNIYKTLKGTKEAIRLPITISFLQSGVVRVTIDEERRQKGDIELRHGSQARKQRYNEAANWAIVGGLELNKAAFLRSEKHPAISVVDYGPENRFQAKISHDPFGIDFNRDGETQIRCNDRGFLNLDQWRPKVDKEVKEEKEQEERIHDAAEDESTWWDESFGGNTDSKPRGPESVGLDITFSGYEHVFGIPEHASPLSLKETRGGSGNFDQPYRLYNSDVFEYEMDTPMTLYGSIPLMQAHRKDSTVGVFWLNGAETWVDIVRSRVSANPLSLGLGGKVDTQTHWFSESGLLDVFIFLGPTPQDLNQKYGELTGYSQLPQSFAIAYHQCRWNYVSEEDVKDVDRKFDRFKIPYDVIWLDIEYTDGKKYFTWDSHTFPDPIGMQKQLDSSDRKLVVIVDPHIKNEGNYHVIDELKSKDLAMKNKDGNVYDGWCWPGSSHWVDCFNPAAVAWWKTLFKYENFKGTTPSTFLWNDMNEPSVFNGPETTAPKDNLHYGNWEHRDIHNINGLTFHNATYHALLERKRGELRRPFVLTRSFFAGSQRLGAMWTGDNHAGWDHLKASIPMILNQGISGFPFAGADVGGFFGNPSHELQTRWYQAGAFYPFFRGHAHIDSRRREPYLLGEPYTSIMTKALRLRYQLLPAWYTAFHQASVDGSPIIRPQYYVHPSDTKGFAIDDQFYLGSSGLLAKPVTSEGADSVDIYLADDETYYDYFDYAVYRGAGKSDTISAPLDKIPLLMQGGHIIPRKDRPRRSSGLMKWDPYTLIVVLDKENKAEGTLYVDDGETFDFQAGAYIHRKFSFGNSHLVSGNLGQKGSKTAEYLKSMTKVRIEKIIIVGAPETWKDKTRIYVLEEGSKGGGRKVEFQWHKGRAGTADWAVVRDPGVGIGRGWQMDFLSP